MPSPDQNWLAQKDPAQAPEFTVRDVLPIATWKHGLKFKSLYMPIPPLNELWTPPLRPLAQTSLWRI